MKGRRTGEHVTFIVSLIIVVGILANLVINHIRNGNSDHLTFSTSIKWNQVHEKEGHFILPVEIINKSPKTANMVKLGIKAQYDDQKFDETIELEYLTQDTPKKVFVLLPFPPQKGKVIAAPLLYTLD